MLPNNCKAIGKGARRALKLLFSTQRTLLWHIYSPKVPLFSVGQQYRYVYNIAILPSQRPIWYLTYHLSLLVPSKVNLHRDATVTANYLIFHHVSSLENQEVLYRKPKLAVMSMFSLGFNATNIKRAAVLRILPHRQSSMHTQTSTQCENVKPRPW